MLCPSKEKRRQKSGGAGTDTTYAGQTLTGRVTAMDGTAVTLALGELSEDAAPAGGASSDNDSQQPPEMPSGDSGSSQPSGTPPEKPGGGSSGDSQQSPEKPEGESGSQSDGGTPPEMPDGSTGGSSFTENGETLTGDCVITSLANNGTINFNGYTITLAGGTVLQ